MGSSCTKTKSPKKTKIFSLPKVSESDKNEQETENVLSARRKSSFHQRSNQNTGKVTFHENHQMNQIMKRNSAQQRSIRETSMFETKRTSEGYKMINEYEIGQKLGEGSFGKVKLVKKKFLGFEQKYATKIFKKHILKRINEFIKDENGSTVIF